MNEASARCEISSSSRWRERCLFSISIDDDADNLPVGGRGLRRSGHGLRDEGHQRASRRADNQCHEAQ